MADPGSFPAAGSSSMTALGLTLNTMAPISARWMQNPSNRVPGGFLTNAFGVVYVPAVGRGSGDGHLLFTREGSLMAQPFDLRRMEPAGEAVSLAQDMISLGRGPGPRPFSASMTGVLAYRTGGPPETTVRSHNSPGLIGQGKCWQPPEIGANTTLWISPPMEPASPLVVCRLKRLASGAGVPPMKFGYTTSRAAPARGSLPRPRTGSRRGRPTGAASSFHRIAAVLFSTSIGRLRTARVMRMWCSARTRTSPPKTGRAMENSCFTPLLRTAGGAFSIAPLTIYGFCLSPRSTRPAISRNPT